jgi:tRNA splicing ligase
MKVAERNNMICKCAKELALAQTAYFQQMYMIAQKYPEIPNIAQGILKALEGENDVEKISTGLDELLQIHNQYFPRGNPLDDSQWKECISQIDDTVKKYKDDIPSIMGALGMAFLDDIEEYDKKWRQYKENGET